MLWKYPSKYWQISEWNEVCIENCMQYFFIFVLAETGSKFNIGQ